MFHKAAVSPVVGTWTNQLGTVWAIKRDGTFQVDLMHRGNVDVLGNYTIDGDTITLKEVRGPQVPKLCKDDGVYKFIRDGDTLTFTKVSDKCKLREKNLLVPWKPWKGK